jgi:hypothetical protein
MRYVKGNLVLRLQRALAAPLLERIRHEFADILRAGTFEQTAALPAEANDPHLAALPRLCFRFNRHSLGRLRMLIDTINREG